MFSVYMTKIWDEAQDINYTIISREEYIYIYIYNSPNF